VREGGEKAASAANAKEGEVIIGSTGESISEVDGAEQMARFRRQQVGCVGDSFPTISAAGGNGSIIHYHAEKSTAASIVPDQVSGLPV
jgi:Xaa-Pro aminopeptidase